MPKKLVKCGTCGVEFDLLTAKTCVHNLNGGLGTMECPNGHCICHLPLSKFRWATGKERSEYDFVYVLKSAFPLIVESKEGTPK